MKRSFFFIILKKGYRLKKWLLSASMHSWKLWSGNSVRLWYYVSRFAVSLQMHSEGKKLELDVEHSVPSAHYRHIFDILACVQIGLLDRQNMYYNWIEIGHLWQYIVITLFFTLNICIWCRYPDHFATYASRKVQYKLRSILGNNHIKIQKRMLSEVLVCFQLIIIFVIMSVNRLIFGWKWTANTVSKICECCPLTASSCILSFGSDILFQPLLADGD